jgi:S1-C subfamily serine protease
MRRIWRVALSAALVATGLGGCDGGGGPKKLSEPELVKKSTPSVVEITVNLANGDAGGTGVVIDARRGLVLTAAHVVQGGSAIKTQALDRDTVPASLVAAAPCDDLAVLKMRSVPSGVTAMPIGDSNSVKSGDNVTVLGYPETLDRSGEDTKLTATSGIVSQPDISQAIADDSPKYPHLIQHQAAINHGNSGGPLVDQYGKLVGINTLTAAGGGSGQIQGQYYSVTINQAKTVLPDLEAGKDVANVGWALEPISVDLLSNYFDESLLKDIVAYLEDQQDTQGLFVLGVDPGSPAAKKNFAEGDYINTMNGRPVTSVSDVCDIVESNPGRTVKVDGRFLASAAAAGKQIGDEYTENLDLP